MKESLLNDDKLTTADIAHPGQEEDVGPVVANRSANASAIDDPDLRPVRTVPASSRTPASPQTIDSRDIQAASPAQQPAATHPASGASGPLFPDDELHNFRTRWDRVQTSFVDEPREAVEQADSLVANVVKRIAEQFSNERTQLEKQWDSGANVSTEELRQALKRYRSFFDRLLAF